MRGGTEREAVARLGDLALDLAAAVTLDDVAGAVLGGVLRDWQADYVGLVVSAPDSDGWIGVRRTDVDVIDDDRLPLLWTRLPASPALPATDAAETGTARFLTGEAFLAAYGNSALDSMDARVRSLAALPLRTADTRGALLVGRNVDEAYDATDRVLLTALAALVGQAVARATAFEAQRDMAELLQLRLLPDRLPDPDRLLIAGQYEPASGPGAVGGDFYDAFLLPDGRLALALGDVMGHGVHAATVMGQVRAALRALAVASGDPLAALGGLDAYLEASPSAEAFVTVLLCVLDLDDHRLQLVSAGHVAPMIRRSDGAVVTVPVKPGPPLGISGPRPLATVVLNPGEVLVAFTDGLVEHRGRDIEEGIHRLAREVAGARAVALSPRALCGLLVDRLAAGATDDIALLAVARQRSPRQSASVEIGRDAAGPRRARAWLRTVLTRWQIAEPVREDALACFAELVTNAYLHAGTGFLAEASLDDERLAITVRDSGTRGWARRQTHDLDSTRGRGLEIVALLSDAWGASRTSGGTVAWCELHLTGTRERPGVTAQA